MQVFMSPPSSLALSHSVWALTRVLQPSGTTGTEEYVSPFLSVLCCLLTHPVLSLGLLQKQWKDIRHKYVSAGEDE